MSRGLRRLGGCRLGRVAHRRDISGRCGGSCGLRLRSDRLGVASCLELRKVLALRLSPDLRLSLGLRLSLDLRLSLTLRLSLDLLLSLDLGLSLGGSSDGLLGVGFGCLGGPGPGLAPAHRLFGSLRLLLSAFRPALDYLLTARRDRQLRPLTDRLLTTLNLLPLSHLRASGNLLTLANLLTVPDLLAFADLLTVADLLAFAGLLAVGGLLAFGLRAGGLLLVWLSGLDDWVLAYVVEVWVDLRPLARLLVDLLARLLVGLLVELLA